MQRVARSTTLPLPSSRRVFILALLFVLVIHCCSCEKTSSAESEQVPAPVFEGNKRTVSNSAQSNKRPSGAQGSIDHAQGQNHQQGQNHPTDKDNKHRQRNDTPQDPLNGGSVGGSAAGDRAADVIDAASALNRRVVSTGQQQGGVQKPPELVLPTPVLCLYRPKHGYANGHFYYYSWIDVMSKSLELNWLEARNWCRQRCMDLVSLETARESNHMKTVVQRTGVPYVWTSGRKCDFAGCERSDLQPVIVNGWFWSGTGVRIPPTDSQDTSSAWSATGGLGKRQPDNREFSETKTEEACLAVLNNFYGDGVKWHDVACYHRKSWICEDSDELLHYAKQVAPHLRII